MDLRERQKPLKDGYRERPDEARITLSARGSQAGEAVACLVDLGRLIADGDIDLRGTLGIDREAPVGFEAIRLRIEVDAPGATDEDLAGLHARTERYCTVLQTLLGPPPIETTLVAAA